VKDKISRISDYTPSRAVDDIIESDGTPEGIVKALESNFAIEDARSFNPDRPYNGQSHTNQGDRGKQLVIGVTMRDIADCMALGILLASDGQEKAYRGVACIGDLYETGDFDPMAAIQNATCQIEKRMGIYPNVPELTSDP